MRERPAWSTRLIVAAGVVIAELFMLLICGFSYMALIPVWAPAWYPVVVDGGSILICSLAPWLSFWLVRRLRSDARHISWLLLIPVTLVNMCVAVVTQFYPEEIEHVWPRWAFLLGSFMLLFFGALSGTLLRAGDVTVAHGQKSKGGVRIY